MKNARAGVLLAAAAAAANVVAARATARAQVDAGARTDASATTTTTTTTTAPSAARQAEESFRAGEQAFAEDDYQAALGHFQRAYAAAPHDAVRFNIAVCLERLGRFREATQQYEAAAASVALEPAQRERARSLAARARQRLGELELVGGPVGAAVQVDGERLCALPCTVALDPRGHELVVTAPGRVAQRRTIELARGVRQRLEVQLANAAADGATTRAVTARGASATTPGRATVARGPGAMTWVGLTIGGLGVAGVAGFGAATQVLFDRYNTLPTRELHDWGVASEIATNAAIPVAVLGAALMLLDLAVFARQRVPAPAPRRPARALARRNVARAPTVPAPPAFERAAP